jgi:hypothetical protein
VNHGHPLDIYFGTRTLTQPFPIVQVAVPIFCWMAVIWYAFFSPPNDGGIRSATVIYPLWMGFTSFQTLAFF